MGYVVAGNELATDDDGFLLEPDYGEEVVGVIAAAEGIELTPKHWEIINYMRDQYREEGHTPNFRNMLKGVNDFSTYDYSNELYDLFNTGPAK
ncbi:MAG: TusE/DsrC/DsvC family sulfur relay protein, partial [Pseudomonadota bacterium]